MKLNRYLGLASALGLSVLMLPAQETNQVEQLQRQLRQLQENFEKTVQLQRQQIEALQQQLAALQPAKPPPEPPAQNNPAPGALPSSASGNLTAAPAATEAKRWSPTDPLRLLGNQRNYLNLSLDGLMAVGGSTASDLEHLQLGGHDPRQRGFTLQNVEMVLDGAVDPYFRAQANLIYQITPEGESLFELEEAFAETTALPWNFQVKAGQYLTEFGRLNPTHPHTWSFVDAPLVNGRFFGEDGLRNPGARVSWLVPTPFYSELYFGVQNSQGGTAYSFRGEAHNHGHDDHDLLFGRERIDRETTSFGDLLFAPRYALSFNLTANQTLLAGASAAFGPNNSGHDTDTQIYGADFMWKWKSPRHHAGFPFVAWQTEAMWRRYEAAAYDGSEPERPMPLPAETLNDYGVYSQLTWGFKKGWVAGFRGDWVSCDKGAYYPDPDRDTRWRLAPNLTWYPTEYSKLRLQYNYDDRKNIGIDHTVWLQLEFLLGAHAAHKF